MAIFVSINNWPCIFILFVPADRNNFTPLNSINNKGINSQALSVIFFFIYKVMGLLLRSKVPKGALPMKAIFR